MSIVFDWEDGPPDGVELLVKARVEDHGSPAKTFLAESEPRTYAPGVELGIDSIAVGSERVLIAELRRADGGDSRVLYYGISEPFDVVAGDDVTAEARVPIRAAPTLLCDHASGGVRLEGVVDGFRIGSADARVVVPSDTATHVRLSNSVNLAEGAVVPLGEALPASAELPEGFLERTAPWTLDPCVDGRVCASRVFLQAVDAEDYPSETCRIEIDLDRRSPDVAEGTVSVVILPPPGALAERVTAATVGATVRVSMNLVEALADDTPVLTGASETDTVDFALVVRAGSFLQFEATIGAEHDEGIYALTLRATDVFGNEGDVTVGASFLVDLVPPMRANNDPAMLRLSVWPNGPDAMTSEPRVELVGAPASVEPNHAIAVLQHGSAQLLGRTTSDASGAFGPLVLAPIDVVTVDVVVIDEAANASPRAHVRRGFREVRVMPGANAELTAYASDRARASLWQTEDDIGTLVATSTRSAIVDIDGVSVNVDAAPGWREHRRRKSNPPRAVKAGMTYDPIRGRTILFGGSDLNDNAIRARTWNWTGDEWLDVTAPGTQPTPRWGHQFVYDRKRGRALLFGGFDNVTRRDQWEWDGDAWSPVVFASQPTWPEPRYDHAMAYNPTEGRIIMCGGWSPSPYQPFYDDCQAWDGERWAPVASPGARVLHAMAFDPGLEELVLYGGRPTIEMAHDDRVFVRENGAWGERTATGPERGLNLHRMVYARGRGILLFSSLQDFDFVENRYDDLWVWTADGFVSLADEVTDHVQRPVPRDSHGLAYDELREELVVYGGEQLDFRERAFDDTWILRDTTWVDVTPSAAGPSQRNGHALIFDSERNETLLYGGVDDDGVRSDLWSWDGYRWRCLATDSIPRSDGACDDAVTTTPPPRVSAAVAFEPISGALVVFGGCTATDSAGLCTDSGVRLRDTWVWNGLAWSASSTVGPSARSDATMTADGAGGLLLVGGCEAAQSGRCTPRGDTWQWAGGAWTQLAPDDTNVTFARATSLYAPQLGRPVVAFGCREVSGTPFEARTCSQDVLSWDGSAWNTHPHAGNAPPARSAAALVHHATRGRFVMFGGEDVRNGKLRDTWELVLTPTAATWSYRETDLARTPPGLGGRRATYDTVRDRVVLFGDDDEFGLNGGVWELDYGADEQPSVVFQLSWPHDRVPLELVESITASIAVGARAFAAQAEDGAALDAWSALDGRWLPRGSNTQGVDSPGVLRFEETSAASSQRWFLERDATLHLRVRPIAWDLGNEPARCAVDGARVRVGYVLPTTF